MTISRRIWAAGVAVVASTGCADDPAAPIEPFIQSDKADGGPKKLARLDRQRIDLDEPSDLVLVDHTLFTVSDAHSKVYRLDLDGDVHTQLDIEGHDLEALGFDPLRGVFVVAGERSGKIWHLAQDGSRLDPFEVDVDDGNSGIEGLAFRSDGRLFVAKEKNPARIFELDVDGTVLDNDKVSFASDISALAFDDDDRLYALSDQDRALFRLDRHHDVVIAWRLPVHHPEGIAFDGDTLYVVSDSEERLYTFELE